VQELPLAQDLPDVGSLMNTELSFAFAVVAAVAAAAPVAAAADGLGQQLRALQNDLPKFPDFPCG